MAQTQALNKQEEVDLADYFVQSAQVGKTRRQVKCLVEMVAKEKGTLKESTKVSDGWWRRFLEWHPNLSLHAGDATAHVRMNAVNDENLTHYHQLLKDCLQTNGLLDHPEQIYNMDETGVPLDPKPPKIVARKGQKKVRYRTSGKKNQITVLGCANAVGQSQPPFVIFDAKQLNPKWMDGEVPGTRYGLSSSGWTDQVLFKGWLVEHFITHAVKGRPLFLLLDGHSSHFEPETIKFAKDNDIIIFCLPPHTTHEAQPLDVSLFGPFKHHWRSVCHEFYKSSPGKVVSKFNFMELFSKAWLKAVTPENICAGFRKAGVVPFNPNAIATATRVVTQSSSDEKERLSDSDNKENQASDANQPHFTTEEVAKFTRRLEEGYDLHDPVYIKWLEQYHPESVSSYTASCKDILPDQLPCAEDSASAFFSDVEPTEPLSVDPGASSTPLTTSKSGSSTCTPRRTLIDSTTLTSPRQTAGAPCPSASLNAHVSQPIPSSCTLSTPAIKAHSTQSTPPVAGSGSSFESKIISAKSENYLSKHLTPITPLTTKSNSTRTGSARILTSGECLAILEEQRLRKIKEAEDKEKRKIEREKKRQEK